MSGEDGERENFEEAGVGEDDFLIEERLSDPQGSLDVGEPDGSSISGNSLGKSGAAPAGLEAIQRSTPPSLFGKPTMTLRIDASRSWKSSNDISSAT